MFIVVTENDSELHLKRTKDFKKSLTSTEDNSVTHKIRTYLVFINNSHISFNQNQTTVSSYFINEVFDTKDA